MRGRLVWAQLSLLAVTAVPLTPGAIAAEGLSRTEVALADEVVARRELVTAAFQRLEATLARDFAAQSTFYSERMEAFYLWRDVPKAAVIAEKRRVFDQARTIDIRIDPPPVMANNLAQMLGHMFNFAIHRGTLENSPVQLLYRQATPTQAGTQRRGAAILRNQHRFDLRAYCFAQPK